MLFDDANVKEVSIGFTPTKFWALFSGEHSSDTSVEESLTTFFYFNKHSVLSVVFLNYL